MFLLRSLVLLASFVGLVSAECPYHRMLRGDKPVATMLAAAEPAVDPKAYRAAAEKLDWAAVKADIKTLLTTSQAFWPADFGNYGPLMIRLAWHCAGSYRSYDGLGGCDGARQRFDPEQSWADNTNLNHARKLLEPIKEKYGLGLSWGDLIILTGNVAIESMGGPVLGFCAGRVDDADGTDSLLLGPTPEQEAHFPCPVNGNCSAPLGANTIGLIYVNPEGPMGQPDPAQSALQIREVFGRMNMNDSETVSLIGGGHAFGKAHGACPKGPGPSPKEDPVNPWPGMCGTGKGNDTFTSGFEGQWTEMPTRFCNMYFEHIKDHKWEVHMGPGGHHQWRSNDFGPNIMMLTTDIALMNDPKGEFQKIVAKYADSEDALKHDFMHAWYKLTTRDMGPVTRCIGPDVPPAQPFQNPLPPTPAKLADFEAVRTAIKQTLTTDRSDVLPSDKDAKGSADYAPAFAYLAWSCASTFRSSDYQGGCNGARIRFAPETEWHKNAGTASALKLLEPVKQQFGEGLSWADLIVLAGTVGLEQSSSASSHLPFCGGRTDASEGSGSASLQPYQDYNTTSAWDFKWKAKMLSLSVRDFVTLQAMPRSGQQMQRLGLGPAEMSKWSSTPGQLSNEYFKTLLTEKWEPVPNSPVSKASGKELYATPTDMLLLQDAELKSAVEDLAKADSAVFLKNFTSAWTKVMNNDRYDGPTANVCDKTEVVVPAN